MSAYTDKAKAAIADFMERSTRFAPKNIAFRDEQQIEASFQVEVSHQLACVLNETTVAGQPECSDTDLEAAERNEYERLSEDLRKEAEGRLDIVRELQRTVSDEAYGLHTTSYEYRRYHRSVHYTCQCGTCQGAGKVSCSSCDGDGRNTCTSCNGMGGQWETRWDTDSKGNSTSSSHYESCSWCLGSGKQTCSTCSGSGTVTCTPCQGHGKVTEIATPIHQVEPSYRLASLHPDDPDLRDAIMDFAGLPRLNEGFATMNGVTVSANEEQRRVKESVKFDCPAYKAQVSAENASAPMVVFGEKCAIANAGNLIESIVQPDLDRLTDAVSRLSFLNLPMTLYAQKIGKLFMESEIHQLAVEQAPALPGTREDYTALTTALSKSLSPAYLEAAVNNLEQLAGWTSKGTTRVVRLAALVAAILLLPDFIQYGEYLYAGLTAAGLLIAANTARNVLTTVQLRRIGGHRFHNFAVKRGVCRTGFKLFV